MFSRLPVIFHAGKRMNDHRAFIDIKLNLARASDLLLHITDHNRS